MPSDGDANSGATASATAPSGSIMASSFMCNVSLPPKLEIHSGKLSKEWKQWRQVWDAYEEVTNLRSKTSRLRVATFITCIGKEALEIHNGLPFRSEEEKSDITKVLELWETHCIGKTNIIYKRYKFMNNRSQEQTESIDTYVTALQALAETCKFGTLKDHLIRDRIVCGVRENAVRRKLLQESGLTLSKCVDICRAVEATSAQLKEMAPSQQSSEVDRVVKAEPKKPNSRKEKKKSPKDQLVEECKFCGHQHERNRVKCPAYGQICSSCGKPNHFAVKCGKKSSDSKKPSQKSKHRKVHQLADSDDASYSSEGEILSVSSQNAVNTVEMSEFKSKIFTHIEIEDVLVKMQVDSGASCNVLPHKFLPKDTVVDTTEVKLTTYSKASLKVLGVAKIQLRNLKNQKYRIQFVVIDEDYTPLLGSTSAQEMGLITVQHENILNVYETVVKTDCQGLTMEEVTASYSDVFKGLGCLEGALHLEVDMAVAPAIMPPRRVPLTLKNRLKDELTHPEKASVIIREEEPTDWVSSLIVTENQMGSLEYALTLSFSIKP